MIMATQQEGEAVRLPTLDGSYRGPFPKDDVRELRALLVRALAAGGFSAPHIVQVTGESRAAVERSMKASPEPEPDDSLPPDVPPGFAPPEPRNRPAVVEVSATFIKSLRHSYGPDSDDPRSRKVGNLDDVRAWLDGLTAGKVRR